MFGRKRQNALLQEEKEAALAGLERVDSISTEVEGRRSRVESLASIIADRRQRNGFGEDYQITLTARRS